MSEEYFTDYPIYIEVPKNYWVVSCNVEYIEKEQNENSNRRKS